MDGDGTLTLKDLLAHISAWTPVRVVWYSTDSQNEWRVEGETTEIICECEHIMNRAVDIIYHRKRRLIVKLFPYDSSLA